MEAYSKPPVINVDPVTGKNLECPGYDKISGEFYVEDVLHIFNISSFVNLPVCYCAQSNRIYLPTCSSLINIVPVKKSDV